MTERMSAAEYLQRQSAKGAISTNGPKFGERVSAKDFHNLLSAGTITSRTMGVRATPPAPSAPPGTKSGATGPATPTPSLATSAPQQALQPKAKQHNRQPEFEEQCALFSWARDPLLHKLHPELRLLSTSLNGVKLTKAQAGKAKAAGMLQGESDVRLPVARGRYIGLIIEMKYGKNKPTPEQLEYGALMAAEGHRFEVCYSCQAAQEVILEYLSQPRPRMG